MNERIILMRSVNKVMCQDTPLLLELMSLIERGNAQAPTFAVTPKFTQVYGNYCGPGNRGGEPIDAIDAACKMHDMCYHYQKRNDCKCDEKLIKDLEDQLKTRLKFRQHYMAKAMILYFKKQLKKTEPCTDERP